MWHLAAASFVNGAVWTGDMPMRRGLMGDIAGPTRMAQGMQGQVSHFSQSFS